MSETTAANAIEMRECMICQLAKIRNFVAVDVAVYVAVDVDVAVGVVGVVAAAVDDDAVGDAVAVVKATGYFLSVVLLTKTD